MGPRGATRDCGPSTRRGCLHPSGDELTRVGMHSRTLMEWVLRIMANLLRPDEIGPAEAAYKAAAALVRLAPNA